MVVTTQRSQRLTSSELGAASPSSSVRQRSSAPGRRAAQHEVGAEAAHRHRRCTRARQRRVQLGQRGLAGHQEREAVGEAGMAAVGRVLGIAGRTARSGKRTSRTLLARATPTARGRPRDRRRQRRRPRRARPRPRSGSPTSAERHGELGTVAAEREAQLAVRERRPQRRQPRQLALGQEAARRRRRSSSAGRARGRARSSCAVVERDPGAALDRVDEQAR